MARPSPALARSLKVASQSLTVATRVAAWIKAAALLDPSEKVFVAFSGGADSTALAIVLNKLGYRVSLGHVDHRMRAESALDAEHCARIAGQMGLSLRVTRVSVNPSTEAAARNQRYPALLSMAQAAGCRSIATGHTLNDQAETVMMRLQRGGFGLGIPPQRTLAGRTLAEGCRVVRPLLQISRAETQAVCDEAGIVYIEDPSNKDLSITRNALRQALSRDGGRRIAPLVELGRANQARVDAQNEALLVLAAEALYVDKTGLVRLNRESIIQIEPEMQRGLIRMALEMVGVEPSSRLVRDLLGKVVPTTGAGLDLPGGLRAWTEPAEIVLGAVPRSRLLPATIIQCPGVTLSPDWGLRIEVMAARLRRRTQQLEPVGETTGPSGPGLEERFGSMVFSAPLSLRQRRPGDRFRPLGGAGSKTLQDFFVDEKVPRLKRDTVPLLFSGDQLIWVAGYRIDDRFKAPDPAIPAATIRITPLDQTRKSY